MNDSEGVSENFNDSESFPGPVESSHEKKLKPLTPLFVQSSYQHRMAPRFINF